MVRTDLDPVDGSLPHLPADAPVTFDTDRLLSPRTASRAVISMYSGALGVLARVRYDPARRRVTFTPEAGSLRVGLEYTVAIHPGLATWDGAITTGDDQIFHVMIDPSAGAPPSPADGPTLSRDVAPLFARRCATEGCHTGPEPVMGLDLSSPAAIVATTVGVISRERPSDRGATISDRTDPHWGAMVRVDAGQSRGEGAPAYSYLFYKIVGDGPIVGAPMPPDGTAPLTPAEITTVSDWIARGAPQD